MKIVSLKEDFAFKEFMSNEMMYTDDLRFGEDYRKLRRCIVISILDYDLLEDASGHHVYRLRDEEGRDFTDLMELHIIELKKKFAAEDRLSDWVKLFSVTTEDAEFYEKLLDEYHIK